MTSFSPKEIDLSTINNGQRFENGQIPEEIAFNAPIEASAYAQSLSKDAITKADEALQKVNDTQMGEISLSAYPIGSIYLSVNETTPAELFGGTWERIKDTFLLASGDTYSLGANGGSANAVVVAHKHQTRVVAGGENGTYNAYPSMTKAGVGTVNTDPSGAMVLSAGEDGTGKNMPPYLVVNVWKRVA